MDWSVAHTVLKRFKNKASSAAASVYGKVARSINIKVSRTRRRKNNLKAWIGSEGVNYLRGLKPYAAYLFIYGLLLNYALYILATNPFPSLNVYTVPAYGVIYYFVKEELTEMIAMIARDIRGI